MLCRRVILVVVVLGLVGSVWATEWEGPGTSWYDAGNWSDGVPGPTDDVDIFPPPEQGPIVVDTGEVWDVNCGRIAGPVWSEDSNMVMEIQGGTVVVNGKWEFCREGGTDGIGTVTISGGDITVKGVFKCADSFGNYGIMNFTGGSFYSTGLTIGEDGSGELNISGASTEVDVGPLALACRRPGSTATFNMSGGLLNVRGGISLGDEQNGDHTDPNAIVINFDGGTIICSDFGMETLDGNTIPFKMDFEEGALLDIGQDRLARIQEYIAAGFITGQDDTVEPSAILVKGHTLVGFNLVQEEASGESPPSGTGNICPNSVTLSWTPGAYCVDDHNVYFGTSEEEVNESTSPYAAHYGSNSITLTNLEVGRAYFWRVDEVNTAEVNSPWKGSVWRFYTEGGVASDPSPDRRGLKAEDVTSLSWSSHCIADAHNVYFGTDLPANIVLFDDDFETGAFEPNWTAGGSWVIFDANGDPNFGGRDANMAKATGSGDLITASVDTTNGDPCVINISFYLRKTEEITNGEIKLYYGYGGGNWDLIADLNSNPEGVNDVWLHYSDSNSNSKYFVNDFKIKLEANISGGTVYIDDVTVTNTWPVDAQWYEARVAGTSYPISVEPMTVYRWRVDTVIDGNVYQGPHWKFSTGFGGLLMYYKFDGTNPFPSPIQDDSDNDIKFYKYTEGAGSVTYGESNPVLAGSTASADFDPNAALYRDDPCGPSEDTRDILRLDGSFTVEMWVMPRALSTEQDEGSVVYLISKQGSWGLCMHGHNNFNFRWDGGAGQSDNGSVEVGEWHHVAVVYDQTDEDLSGMYINGDEQGGAGGHLPPDNNSPIWIGCRVLADGNLGNFFDGILDEIRVHDIALRPCEFLLFRPEPEYAYCPIPEDDESEVDPCTVELIWNPGDGAVSHDIYFSSDYFEVVGGSPVETGYVGSSWTPTTLPLDNGTVYYWRIDTYDNGGPPYEGEVWQFTTEYVVEDANLLLHYKLDESAGDDAIDASGHGHHGDVDNEDNWDPDGGHFGGCLIFDDDQRIDVPSEATSAITDEITISVWLYGYDQDTKRDNWVLQINEGTYSVDVKVPDAAGDVYWRAGNDSNDALVWNDATPSGWEDSWHFFAFIKDESADLMKIYFDGLEVKSKDEGTKSSLTNVAGKPFDIGAKLSNSNDYEGKMDDLRVYGKALSAKEVGAVMRGGDVERAWGPNPYFNQLDAAFNADLTWRPGDWAASHKVYFGTSWEDVNSMTDPCATKDLGDESYDPGILELDKTYFWRVDEVNDACDPNGWRGYVWHFKTADHIIIDDMEDYSTDYPLRKTPTAQTWGWDDYYVNSTGAFLNLQTIPPIHGGDQSMSCYYDNSGSPFYSEFSNHFPMDPNDWDALGLKMLSLWFYGHPDNDACETEQMYVGLDDHDGTYAEVRYPLEDMEDITVEDWQQWNIPLNEFTTVNLEDVNKLYIGFGDRENPVQGGVGYYIYFDDIRAYLPTCVLAERPSEFVKYDLYPDCTVNFDDVSVMAGEWLKADVNLGAVTKPDDANLLGWWKFDEGSGSDAYDYSTNSHHGDIETIDVNVWWVTGRNDVNYALDFDGGRVRVADTAALRPLDAVSAAAWIKYAASQNSARLVVKGADNKETYELEVNDDGVKALVRDGNDPNAESYDKYEASSGSGSLNWDEWIHVAGTFDGNDLKCYVNGELKATTDASALVLLSQDANDLAIGNRSDDDDHPFVGTIDDVRVYDYGLSAEEVRYLATDGTGWVAMQSIANLVYDEPLGEGAVNLRDFAELADSWLEEKLYPE